MSPPDSTERRAFLRGLGALAFKLIRDVGEDLADDALVELLAAQLDEVMTWPGVPEPWRRVVETMDGPVLVATIRATLLSARHLHTLEPGATS